MTKFEGTKCGPVEVGQLWVDNNPRIAKRGRKRYVRVNGILRDTAGDSAVCEAWYDEAVSRSRTVTIRLDRFRPMSTGYRLATDQERVAQGMGR